MFQLDFAKGAQTEQLQIRKVDMPTTGVAATKVQISPDNRWISWVEEGSKVMAARVHTTESEIGPTYTISQPYKLHRLRRQIPKHLLLGGLGSYDRNVTQMAFSPDSKLFSVADLAGFIDTWVLRGPGEGANGTSGEDDDDAASESSDDSSDEETDDIAGERWVRNPNAKLLPKLSAAPVLLSFAKTQRDDGDYDLMTITAVKTLLVFNPLRGALSEWSRRNTYPKLPGQFRDTRDQVKGAVWQGHRAWIYGVSSLFMLDLSQDFDLEEQKKDASQQQQRHGTKRKRGVQDGGAGGKMDKQSLAPQRVKTALGPDGARWEDVEMADADADDQKSVGASSGVDDDDDDDADDTDGGELQRLRDDRGVINGDAADAGEEEEEEGSSKAPPKWWHSYQFRPILGIVPVESLPGLANGVAAAAGPEGLPPLEVALVERPLTGEDLPERYFAEGEWER